MSSSSLFGASSYGPNEIKDAKYNPGEGGDEAPRILDPDPTPSRASANICHLLSLMPCKHDFMDTLLARRLPQTYITPRCMYIALYTEDLFKGPQDHTAHAHSP